MDRSYLHFSFYSVARDGTYIHRFPNFLLRQTFLWSRVKSYNYLKNMILTFRNQAFVLLMEIAGMMKLMNVNNVPHHQKVVAASQHQEQCIWKMGKRKTMAELRVGDRVKSGKETRNIFQHIYISCFDKIIDKRPHA